jgi:gustatory receptor
VCANSENYRMKTPTSKAVTSLDMMVVVTSCIMGVICGCVSLQQTQELNDRLREADETLALYTDERKDKKRGLVIFICVLLIITSTVGECWNVSIMSLTKAEMLWS